MVCRRGLRLREFLEDPREEAREDALNAFLEARVREGYVIETHTDTHAIIAPPGGWSSLNPFRKAKERLVVSVDDEGKVTVRAAEPLRS
jgi:hypothetical protein